MIRLAITLVHNKTDAQNAAQIEAVKLMLEYAEEAIPVFDENGVQTGTTARPYDKLTGLAIPHEIKVFQIVPYGVTPPPNRYDINSGGIVYYGVGDEDKTGTHPRFFNWGLKRGTDNGADVSIYLEDVTQFDISKLEKKLDKLINKNDDTEYAEDTYGKLATVKLLREVGQLKEDRSFVDAITELKGRVVEKGLKDG